MAALTVRYMAEEINQGPFVGHSRDVQRLLSGRFRDLDRETFAVVFLDTRHRILAVEDMFQGTINSATVFPREIVKRALQLNAAAIVAVHNHPSGNPEPSSDDRQVTRALQRACGLMDISLLDHVIIGGNDCFSFAEHQLL
jgi:DNA repair protein RadC